MVKKRNKVKQRSILNTKSTKENHRLSQKITAINDPNNVLGPQQEIKEDCFHYNEFSNEEAEAVDNNKDIRNADSNEIEPASFDCHRQKRNSYNKNTLRNTSFFSGFSTWSSEDTDEEIESVHSNQKHTSSIKEINSCNLEVALEVNKI